MIALHKRQETPALPVGQVQSLTPFEQGLEYASPARGPWNIVHIGMLIPESHQIFVCGQSCLRGVVLTAAELGVMDRFSTITVDEGTVLEGDCEDVIVAGVADVLEHLPVRPKVLLLFTSCIHHFIGADLRVVYQALRARFPDVIFLDAYMNPIMRKSKLPPDPFLRRQLYAALEPMEKDGGINIIGDNVAVDGRGEAMQMLLSAGKIVRQLPGCETFDAYRKMAASSYNLVHNPLALPAAKALEERLGQPYLYLPAVWDFDAMDEQLRTLSQTLSLPLPDLAALRAQAEQALEQTAAALAGMEIAVDYSALTRPLGLVRLLRQAGLQVQRLYIDAISPDEQADLQWLQAHAPDLVLHPTIHPVMAIAPRPPHSQVLAIGQKAAYFENTGHFVNIVEDGGLYGYGGLCALLEQMRKAAVAVADTASLIQIKGWGCCG